MGESQRVRKNNRKNKKENKSNKKKIPSEMCWVDALFWGPGKSRFKTWEANCRWGWRENVQISKKTKRDKQKVRKNASGLRTWGEHPKLGVLGLQKRRPKSKTTLVEGVRD